jgi:hypothetical protein
MSHEGRCTGAGIGAAGRTITSLVVVGRVCGLGILGCLGLPLQPLLQLCACPRLPSVLWRLVHPGSLSGVTMANAAPTVALVPA